MAMKSGGKVPWALVLVALAAIAASGRGCAWAQAARNETGASANGQTLEALLSTTSRAFSTSQCVESIRIMKHTWNEGDYPSIDVSFPPDNSFTPPGAEAWCNCLLDNEPDGGISSDFEGVFDKCRDQVLVNSDYNAMDICRGMMKMYGEDLYDTYTTFCARRLCSSRDDFGDYKHPDPDRGFGDPYYFDPYSDARDLDDTCGTYGCVDELSAGYCAKYRLAYGGWVRSIGVRYDFGARIVAVDGNEITFSNGFGIKQFGDPLNSGSQKTRLAKAICDALYPTDQGRCCTYGRGYAALSQCCYVKDGALEFNCAESYGGARLFYNCMSQSGPGVLYQTKLYDGCRALIDYYVAHSTYRQANLAELPSGRISVVFPEAFMDDFCDSDEFYNVYVDGQYDVPSGTREYCCNKMNLIFGELVENCQPGAGSHTSLGATRLPPSVTGLQPTLAPEPEPEPEPTPPSCDACSYVDQNGDCKTVCKKGEECTVRRGKALCVRCNFFQQDFPDGKNRQCCELRDGDAGTLCRSKVNNKSEKNKCLANEGPWNSNKGVPRNPQPYTIDAVRNVCNARDNFWVNRKLCKVKQKANGEKKCKYINKNKRNRILAGR